MTSCKQPPAVQPALGALAGRAAVHNSARFSSMQRVANIPRFALHVHNALRRYQGQTDPHLCTKPQFFILCSPSPLTFTSFTSSFLTRRGRRVPTSGQPRVTLRSPIGLSWGRTPWTSLSEFLKTEFQDLFINFLLTCTVSEWRKAVLQYDLNCRCKADNAADYGINFYSYTDDDMPEEYRGLVEAVNGVFDAVKYSICRYVNCFVEIYDDSSDVDQNRDLLRRLALDEMRFTAFVIRRNLVKMARYLIPGERAIYDAISEICDDHSAHSTSSIAGIFNECYHDILYTADIGAAVILSRYKAHKGTTEVKK